MIVVELNNNLGLGNQFFIYAYAYALSKRENQKMIIFSRMNHPFRKYILDDFCLDEKMIVKVYRLDKIHNRVIWRGISWFGKHIHKLFGKKYFYINENNKENRVFKEIPCGLKNYWLKGNFECYRYFHQYRSLLIKQYVYKEKVQDETREFLKVIDNDSWSVALHIRRGDFINLDRCVPIEFYEKAIEFFEKKEKGENYHFYLACEDENVINHFKRKYSSINLIEVHQGENKDIETWICLLHCKNHIITNSTYSWWAAYLSNKGGEVITLSPNLYEMVEENKEGYREFYLPEWIPLEI